MSQFYALMSDNTVKHISLKEEIVTEIKNIFINGGAIFKPEGIEEDVFDGNIISRNGENITYVHYDLPEDFARIPYNQADMSEYNINEDMPKSIFITMTENSIFRSLIRHVTTKNGLAV